MPTSPSPTVVTNVTIDTKAVCFGWAKHPGTKLWRGFVETLAKDPSVSDWSDGLAEDVRNRLHSNGFPDCFISDAETGNVNDEDQSESTSVKGKKQESGAWRKATPKDFLKTTKRRFRDFRKPSANKKRASRQEVGKRSKRARFSIRQKPPKYPIIRNSVCLKWLRHPGTVTWLEIVYQFAVNTHKNPEWKDSIMELVKNKLGEHEIDGFFVFRDADDQDCTDIQKGLWYPLSEDDSLNATKKQFESYREHRKDPPNTTQDSNGGPSTGGGIDDKPSSREDSASRYGPPSDPNSSNTSGSISNSKSHCGNGPPSQNFQNGMILEASSSDFTSTEEDTDDESSADDDDESASDDDDSYARQAIPSPQSEWAVNGDMNVASNPIEKSKQFHAEKANEDETILSDTMSVMRITDSKRKEEISASCVDSPSQQKVEQIMDLENQKQRSDGSEKASTGAERPATTRCRLNDVNEDDEDRLRGHSPRDLNQRHWQANSSATGSLSTVSSCKLQFTEEDLQAMMREIDEYEAKLVARNPSDNGSVNDDSSRNVTRSGNKKGLTGLLAHLRKTLEKIRGQTRTAQPTARPSSTNKPKKNKNPALLDDNRSLVSSVIFENHSLVHTEISSLTTEADLQRVANEAVFDSYGDKGMYTGFVLRSSRMPHGLGRMKYDEGGRTYEGSWSRGRWHGYGRASFSNGDRYEGVYRFGRHHGQGIYRYNNGKEYDGNFKNDQYHGKGSISWPDGASYKGDFVDGKQEGCGHFVDSNGDQYKGAWKDGRFEGFGTFTWQDGRCYRGEWRHGMANGTGVETNPDGRVLHDGEWIDDEPIKPKAVNSAERSQVSGRHNSEDAGGERKVASSSIPFDAVVKVQLQDSADEGADDEQGLLRAAAMGEFKLVQYYVVQKGANLNARDVDDGSTPLHLASRNSANGNYLRVITLLLNKGAELNTRNIQGRTPLHGASRDGLTATVALLLDRGADANAKENDGSTPLHLASSNGHETVVTWLLECGADVDAKDYNGRTSLDMASENGHGKIVTLLLKKKAERKNDNKLWLRSKMALNWINESDLTSRRSSDAHNDAQQVQPFAATTDADLMSILSDNISKVSKKVGNRLGCPPPQQSWCKQDWTMNGAISVVASGSIATVVSDDDSHTKSDDRKSPSKKDECDLNKRPRGQPSKKRKSDAIIPNDGLAKTTAASMAADFTANFARLLSSIKKPNHDFSAIVIRRIINVTQNEERS